MCIKADTKFVLKGETSEALLWIYVYVFVEIIRSLHR